MYKAALINEHDKLPIANVGGELVKKQQANGSQSNALAPRP